MLAPEDSAFRRVDRKQIVGNTGDNHHLLRPGFGCHLTRHQRGEKVTHHARLAVELQFPQQLHVFSRMWG